MINPRGAISLSINMIVMIIISITILTGGIILVNNLVGGAEDIQEQLDQSTQQRLNYLLIGQGQQVALPFHTATVVRGGKHLFGIGILNTGDVGDQFKLVVEWDSFIDLSGQQQALTTNPIEWARYTRQELTISTGENIKEPILIKVPETAPSGQYLFKAKVVLADGETYGNVQRFYVAVK